MVNTNIHVCKLEKKTHQCSKIRWQDTSLRVQTFRKEDVSISGFFIMTKAHY